MTILAVVLLAVTVGFVGLPLFRRQGRVMGGEHVWQPEAARRRRLLAERDAALAALKDLDLDHATGNLTDGDFQEMASGYRLKAMTLMRELDAIERAEEAPLSHAGGADDMRLEEHIARVREQLRGRAERPST